MRNLEYTTDLCVVGGGLAGLCCAIAAARNCIKTVLIEERKTVLKCNLESRLSILLKKIPILTNGANEFRIFSFEVI